LSVHVSTFLRACGFGCTPIFDACRCREKGWWMVEAIAFSSFLLLCLPYELSFDGTMMTMMMLIMMMSKNK